MRYYAIIIPIFTCPRGLHNSRALMVGQTEIDDIGRSSIEISSARSIASLVQIHRTEYGISRCHPFALYYINLALYVLVDYHDKHQQQQHQHEHNYPDQSQKSKDQSQETDNPSLSSSSSSSSSSSPSLSTEFNSELLSDPDFLSLASAFNIISRRSQWGRDTVRIFQRSIRGRFEAQGYHADAKAGGEMLPDGVRELLYEYDDIDR